VEGRSRGGLVRRSAVAVVALSAALLPVAGCGGGGDDGEPHSHGIELASRLPSDDALNVAIADVTAIRKSIGMAPGAVPPTKNDDHDLSFLDEISPALGVVGSGVFPQSIVDAALARTGWIAGVAGDEGVTAFSISGDSADLVGTLEAAGLKEDGGEYVDDDGNYAIALGDGLIVFADDPGDAEAVVDKDDGDVPEELVELDGDGQLITLSRFGADCVDAVATTDTPGENGEIAYFTTATPDPAKISGDGVNSDRTRIEGGSARVSIPAAESPADEPPALKALQTFAVDYDCDA
jgi:hypothetical protein